MTKLTRASLLLLLLASSTFSQDEEEGEHYFMRARVIVQIVKPDSLTVEFAASAEDMVNTVGIVPADNSDPKVFRLYESKAEAYLQERLPVYIDGKRLYLKVVQWKPGGKGRADGFDSLSVYSPIRITLGGKLPKSRNNLDITATIWAERSDAGPTEVEFRLYDGEVLLKHYWSKRDKKQRFQISSESLSAQRKHPLPPVSRDFSEVEHE